ncbi:MAG: NAD(P)-dependent oxidoreductase [Candidatus Riflebacteria bacterium]|nr:NAD(P)-dependent oxidoreductase [Candidatus Riflebacteria bacterium]
MKEKVVVIGGSGFLGSHLADVLSESGFFVTIYDIRPSPWLRPDQEMVTGDIRDEMLLEKALQKASYVYHLAGIADIGYASRNPRETVETNILGSTIIIEQCIKAKIKRFLMASTMYVFSQKGSFYRVSKQAVELLLEAYSEKSALEYTILRYGSLYGPRAQEWNSLKNFVNQAVKEGRISYPGFGDERREYIHVLDAAQMSVKALSPEYANQRLILTGAQILNSKELTSMINEILGGGVKVEFYPENRDPAHYELTPYRMTHRVAYKMVPEKFIDIGQGILELIEELYDEKK